MPYFDYHARVKKMIREGKLQKYWFDKCYKNMGFCLLLNFGEKTYPIREEKFFDYFELIGDNYSITQVGAVFITSNKID